MIRKYLSQYDHRDGVSLSPEKILAILPITLLLGIAEGLLVTFIFKKSKFDWGYLPTAIGDIVSLRIVSRLLNGGLTYFLIAAAEPYRLYSIELASWWSWLLLFMGADFLFYVMHRCAHGVPLWWAHHSVHHTPNRLSLMNADINGVSVPISGLTIFFVPLVLVGFPPQAVFKVVLFIMAYQTSVHLEWFPKLGIVDRILVTPSNHRLHHAVNAEFINANFGGVTVLYDHIFGTFKDEPRDNSILRYGLTIPEYTYNPFRIFFKGYVELYRRMRAARSFRERLLCLLRTNQSMSSEMD